jgi:uncharacterized membrane protein
MAGIGFTLKKLTQKDNLHGVVHAYGIAMLAAAGPWLFTVFTLAGITSLGSNFFFMEGLENFRVLTIYNFAFSLVLSAPVFMVATRYLADNIHLKDVTNVPSVMLGCLALLYMIQLPVGIIFYLGYVDLPLNLQLSAILNLCMITSVWLLSVFLTALKDYNAVAWAYGLGMVIAIVMAKILQDFFADAGMLNGLSIGLAFIVFSLAAKVFSEYSYSFANPFDIRGYFKKYWQLALGGFLYNAAIWVDKWIMWFAPEAWLLDSKLRMYPDYDSATFFAYLTIVPAMAVFVFSVETNFFERYQRFYDDILGHKPLRKILANQKAVIESILNSSRNFIIVQGALAFMCIAFAPKIFELININFNQIGIYRISVLGAFFHVLMLFEIIILSYFDNRRMVMWIAALYLALNAVITLWTLVLGFPYYGYGYFLSSMIVFVVTSVILFNYIRKLPYHAFITSNNSVRDY